MKDIKNKSINFLLKGGILIIISIFFTVASYMGVYINSVSSNNGMVVKNLENIGRGEKNSLNRLIKEINYDIQLYSNLQEMKDMNKEKIEQYMSFLKSSKDRYKNIVILDNKNNIVYGYVLDKPKLISSGYVNNAITSGKINCETTREDDIYSINIASPIKNDEDKLVGLLCIEVSLQEIQDIVKNSRNDENTESYIVDRDGVMVTESKFVLDAVGKEKIDLKKLKLSIDYSKDIAYKDYRGTDVYGRYFDLDIDGWTLIIETDVSPNKDKQKKIKLPGEILAIVQGITMIGLQVILKKKFGIDLDIKDLQKLSEAYLGDNIEDEHINEEFLKEFQSGKGENEIKK